MGSRPSSVPAPLLELCPLAVELDSPGRELAEPQQRLGDLRLGGVRRDAHQHDGERADAPLGGRHAAEELGAGPGVWGVRR